MPDPILKMMPISSLFVWMKLDFTNNKIGAIEIWEIEIIRF